MTFELDKKNALGKLDKSSKGSIDEKIMPLVELFNSKDNYYTTSTCSGRILLIAVPDENKKYNSNWEFLSHSNVDFSEIKSEIDKIDTKDDVWFKQEPAIIHVCCRTLDDASNLLELCKHLGFKRSGISTISNKIMLELISTENMGVPVIKSGKLLVDYDYLRILVEEANKKLNKTHEKIDKLLDKLKEL